MDYTHKQFFVIALDTSHEIQIKKYFSVQISLLSAIIKLMDGLRYTET